MAGEKKTVTAGRLQQLLDTEREHGQLLVRVAAIEQRMENQPAAPPANGPGSAPAAESEGEKALRLQLEAEREKTIVKEVAEFRARMLESLRAEIKKQNTLFFGSMFGRFALEECERHVVESVLSDAKIRSKLASPLYGEPELKSECEKSVNEYLGRQKRMTEEANNMQTYGVSGAAIASQIAANPMVNQFPQIGALSPYDSHRDRRAVGVHREMAYGSDGLGMRQPVRNLIRDAVLAQMWKGSVTNAENVSWLDDSRRMNRSMPQFINQLVHQQMRYESNHGTALTDNHIFARGKLLHNILNSESAKRAMTSYLTEAAGSTSDDIFGTVDNLPVSISPTFVMGIFPQLITPQVAAEVGVMLSRKMDVYDLKYPRDAETTFRLLRWNFGHIDSAAPTVWVTGSTVLADGETVVDLNALSFANGQVPARIFARVHEVVSVATTFTLTGTDGAGNTAHLLTVTINPTDPVGAVRECVPTSYGARFFDITTGTASGFSGAGNGEVSFFAQYPIQGADAGTSGVRAEPSITIDTVTAVDFDIHTILELTLIEDIETSFNNQHPGQAINAIALMGQLLSNDLKNYVDQYAIRELTSNVYSENVYPFDSNTPPNNVTLVEHRGNIGYIHDNLQAIIHYSSGRQPNNAIWHTLDKPNFVNWIRQFHKEALTTFSPQMNDPFENSRAQFQISNMNVFVSENIDLSWISLSSNNKMTGLHYMVLVPIILLQGQDPGAGFQTVIQAHHRAGIKNLNNRSTGRIEVS